MEDNDAENLLELAKLIPSRITEYNEMDGKNLAQIKTALDFQRADAGFQLRALVERMRLEDINREIY